MFVATVLYRMFEKIKKYSYNKVGMLLLLLRLNRTKLKIILGEKL